MADPESVQGVILWLMLTGNVNANDDIGPERPQDRDRAADEQITVFAGRAVIPVGQGQKKDANRTGWRPFRVRATYSSSGAFNALIE
ncbi:MAG: hypothetical protein ACN6N0_13200 [Microvirgula sp.]